MISRSVVVMPWWTPLKPQNGPPLIWRAVPFSDSAVLTLDKKGPLRRAYERGGTVVFLNDFDSSALSLRGYVLKALT
jgi:hypothetical protein